jgi:GMP synthase-like glutamine amidotransferase
MHIAILVTNTDESDFAQAHPKDGQKFSDLLWRVRPDWTFDVYQVKDGHFPDALDFDGILITGSPASVHDGAPWIAQLEELVRDALKQKTPMFGACFGHQIIARALGARVGYNPQGWVFGRVETEFLCTSQRIALYAAHKEQVFELPAGAEIVARTDGCEIAGFSMNTHVLTTQYHPEMTSDFMSALIAEFADTLGRGVAERARSTMAQNTDMDALAEWIAQFYEAAL